MAIRSQKTDAKQSAIVDRATLKRQRGAIERWTALVVLFASFLGTIVAWAGGWPAFLDGWAALTPAWGAIAGGLGMQALLTFLQWYYFDVRFVSWPARLADAAFTAVGYGPLFVAPPAADAPIPGSSYVAWLIVALVSLAVAWYPESRLVD